MAWRRNPSAMDSASGAASSGGASYIGATTTPGLSLSCSRGFARSFALGSNGLGRFPQAEITINAAKTAILVQDKNTADEHSNEGQGEELHYIRHGSGSDADGGQTPAIIGFTPVRGATIAEEPIVVGTSVQIQMCNRGKIQSFQQQDDTAGQIKHMMTRTRRRTKKTTIVGIAVEEGCRKLGADLV